MSQLIDSDLKNKSQVNAVDQHYSISPNVTHHIHLLHLLNSFMKKIFHPSSFYHSPSSNPTPSDDSLIDEFKDLFKELKTTFNDLKHHDVNHLLQDLEQVKKTLSDVGNEVVNQLMPQAFNLIETLVHFVSDVSNGDLKKSQQDLDLMKNGLNTILHEILGKYDSGKVAALINDVENSLENLMQLGGDIYAIVQDAQSQNYPKLLKDIYDLSGNVTGVLQDVESFIQDITGKNVKQLTDIIAIAKDLRDGVKQVYDNLGNLKNAGSDALKIVEDLMSGKSSADMNKDISAMEDDLKKLDPGLKSIEHDLTDLGEKIKDLVHQA